MRQWELYVEEAPPPTLRASNKCGGGQVTVASFGSAYGILVLTRNSYLAFLHMIACMYEINAPIFGGHWESMHFKWAYLNSNVYIFFFLNLNSSNYRPVSILPVVAKLVESVVCIQLLQYLLSHSILTDLQHGFRPVRKTESAMLDAVSFFMDCLDRGEIACLTTADTSKAFDSVQHQRLIEKMRWYGIHDHWFRDWLEGRSQRVKGGKVSLPITHGVVQGSLLGPILFILFSNDLPCYVEDCKLVIYADDVQFGHRGELHQIADLENRVERTINSAQQWFSANSLKINPTKTDLVLIESKRRKESNSFSITVGDTKIEPSSSTKVLGMIVDSNLTFEAQISAVIRRCYATIGGLAKLSRSLPENVKKMIIETLVFPHLTYCMTVWAGCGISQKQRLQKVLNHCAQIVKGVRRGAHVTPLLREMQWPCSDDLIAERDMDMLHWLLRNQHAPVSLRERPAFRENVSSRRTRATEAGQLQLPKVRTEQARRYFHFRAVSSWNEGLAVQTDGF